MKKYQRPHKLIDSEISANGEDGKTASCGNCGGGGGSGGWIFIKTKKLTIVSPSYHVDYSGCNNALVSVVGGKGGNATGGSPNTPGGGGGGGRVSIYFYELESLGSETAELA